MLALTALNVNILDQCISHQLSRNSER